MVKKVGVRKVIKKKAPSKVKKSPSAYGKTTATKLKRKAVVKRKRKVLAIPKGYHSITPYLIIKNAAKAIEFYKKVFGAKETTRLQMPDGRVGHAELKIGDAKIMLADECTEMGAKGPQSYGGSPVSIHLYIKDVDEVVKRAVKAGAKLKRAVENMFYGDRSGMVEDPYGHTWSISTHIEDVSPAKTKKRAAELFGNKPS